MCIWGKYLYIVMYIHEVLTTSGVDQGTKLGYDDDQRSECYPHDGDCTDVSSLALVLSRPKVTCFKRLLAGRLFS